MSSRGWADPVPDPLLLRKSGRAGNRTQDLWLSRQKLWPQDHRGGLIDAWFCKIFNPSILPYFSSTDTFFLSSGLLPFSIPVFISPKNIIVMFYYVLPSILRGISLRNTSKGNMQCLRLNLNKKMNNLSSTKLIKLIDIDIELHTDWYPYYRSTTSTDSEWYESLGHHQKITILKNSVIIYTILKNHLMMAYLGRNMLWLNKNMHLCDGNCSIFICKHQK
jgi:hypothetical protein